MGLLQKNLNKKALVLLIGALAAFYFIYPWAFKRLPLLESRGRSPYAKIIFDTSEIRDKEYPLRPLISEGSIKKIKFMDPRKLGDNIETLIIVLGDRPLDRTTPTVNMVYRTLKAVELSKASPEAVLIMSGGRTAGDISEARMMGLVAWSRGVDPSRIILENKSKNTDLNAGFSAKIVKLKNIGKVFVITDRSRLERAIRIFQNYGEFKNAQGIDCDVPDQLMIEQMEGYLKAKDNRIVRRRLQQLKNKAKVSADNAADRISEYEKIISNTANIRSSEFPERNPLSGEVIAKTGFMDPQRLKDGTAIAIFVLPNRPLDGVTPSIDSVYRALKAVELSKKFADAAVIMLGPKTVGDISEAQMMALVAWSRGVDPSKIFVEDKARKKEDKAEFIAKMIRSENIGRAYIVSKREHLRQMIPFFRDRYKGKFNNVSWVDCGITKDLIIGQMEHYLGSNDDGVVRRRLADVKKGRIGID